MAPPQPVTQLVAVGSSAGGVEALSALVASLPADFPAPLVIAQHLDPTRPSHLQEILARHSPLPVSTVIDDEPLVAGVVYVVPADRHVVIDDHHLHILAAGDDHPKPSINGLFRSAAAAYGEGLIAVVLSGLGSDGATGARHVKEAGGTVVIQNPRTAPYPSMPEALAPNTVDVIADAGAMGPLLRELLSGGHIPSGPHDDNQMRGFLAELREQSGVDFAQYKEPTIQRRLQRRLLATGTRSLEDYRAYMRGHPEESARLVNSFLIKVTAFFRDPALFGHLRNVVVPALVEEGRKRDRVLRLWSAGCATGEEAYSLALLIAEALGDELARWTIRIFATDLDRDAVAFARRGIYPAAALEGAPPELVAQYLVESDGTYTVNKTVRGMLVFGEHDLSQRPPFPQIDLCLCRNVLIYFTPTLQRRALEIFAFALRDGGYLALGQAETIGAATDYYISAHWSLRLFQRHGARLALPGGSGRLLPAPSRQATAVLPARELEQVREEIGRAQRRQNATEQLLQSLPVGVAVVDRHYDLQRLNGMARRLLGLRTEALGEDLMHQLHGLAPMDLHALRTAVDAALRGASRTLEGMATTAAEPGATRYLRIACQPAESLPSDVPAGEAPPTQQGYEAVLVITDVTDAVAARQGEATARAEAAQLEVANADLRETARALQAANEDLAGVNALLRGANEESVLGSEEMQAAAEELEVVNEEQQATNEELETLNEEQQATNEELETTNAELEARHAEARELATAVEEQRRRLAAILSSMGEAVLVIDRAGRAAFSNAVFTDIFGAEIGGNAESAFVAQDAEGHRLPLEATPQERARQGESFRMQFTRLDAQGHRRWYEATGCPVHRDSRQSAGATDATTGGDSVLVIHDITDRTVRQLQDAFMAVASHELRTPLTPINGYLELLARGLARGVAEPERLANFVRLAQAELKRLKRLVEDLLDASRLQGGLLRLQRAPLDLAELARHAIATAQFIGEGRSMTLDLAYVASDAPVTVNGDADRLEQVLLNLITNALVHAPDAPITVRLRQSDGMAELAVTDEGPGIAREAQAQLFTRFYQENRNAPGALSRHGLGLGLYIAREIMEAHGGTIAVESEPGYGATFALRLPLLAEPAAAEAADGQRPAD